MKFKLHINGYLEEVYRIINSRSFDLDDDDNLRYGNATVEIFDADDVRMTIHCDKFTSEFSIRLSSFKCDDSIPAVPPCFLYLPLKIFKDIKRKKIIKSEYDSYWVVEVSALDFRFHQDPAGALDGIATVRDLNNPEVFKVYDLGTDGVSPFFINKLSSELRVMTEVPDSVKEHIMTQWDGKVTVNIDLDVLWAMVNAQRHQCDTNFVALTIDALSILTGDKWQPILVQKSRNYNTWRHNVGIMKPIVTVFDEPYFRRRAAEKWNERRLVRNQYYEEIEKMSAK